MKTAASMRHTGWKPIWRSYESTVVF